MSVNPNEVRFREAQTQECAMLNDLAIRSKSYWPYSTAYLEGCRIPLELTPEYLKQWHVTVMEVGGEVAGFFSFYIHKEKKYLDQLWLEPKYIGKSFGQELFQEAKRWAKSQGWFPFWINADPFALKFYLRNGCEMQGFYESRVIAKLFLPLLICNQ